MVLPVLVIVRGTEVKGQRSRGWVVGQEEVRVEMSVVVLGGVSVVLKVV